jgi:predicted MFS family arabinose efflux permease
MGYGLFFWLPSYFVRSYGLSLLDASVFYGGILLLGGIAGTWLGGVLADRLGEKNRSAYVMVPAIAFLLTIPFYVLAISSSTLLVTFLALLVPTALGLAWLGPVLSAMQHIVRPHMRATTSAIFLFINNLVGIGAGTVALGIISDSLIARFGDDSLKYAILSGTVFYLIAAALFWLSAKKLGDDWED